MDTRTGIDLVIAGRLENWSRRYRPSIPVKTCGSAEGNYRPPWRQWLRYDELPISTPIDIRDAETVEAAWRSLPVRRYRQILKMAHMTDAPDYVIARKAGTKVWKLPHDYRSAVQAIALRLESML